MMLNLAAAKEHTLSAMATCDLPGLAMAVIHRNETVFAGGWGHWDAAARYPIDADTVFGVASLTKLVTTLVILRLASSGRLSIDDRIDKYFPVLHNNARQPILLRHLLNHTGGFPGLPFRFFAADTSGESSLPGGIASGLRPSAGLEAASIPPLFTPDELAAAIANYPFDWLGNPGEQLNYCNEGFCLLGGVAEQTTGQPFAQLAQDLVFDPLGMRRTRIGTPHPGATDNNQVALPLLKSQDQRCNGQFWLAPLFYPAGGATATAIDIARLLHGLSESAPVLTGEQRRAVMTRAVAVPSRPQTSIGYGLGLEVWQIDAQTTLCWHTGQRAGIASFMAWLPAEQLALSLLSNVSDAPVARIGHSILGKMIGRPEMAWPAPTTGNQRADASQTEGQIHRYCGEYRTAEGNVAWIRLRHRELIMRRRSDGPWQPLDFADGTSGVVGQETFRFLENGSLAIDLRTLPRVGAHVG